jgi:hypothetical protein
MISKGQLSYDTKLYAIFVYNIDGRIPGYMRSWIDALNRQKINIWIITNKTLAEKTRAELLTLCDLFVERHNIGRDFGAYKDGISLLKSRQIDAQHLLLSNDSVFYCGKDLEGTIEALLAGGGLSGLCRIYDGGYHVQSYLLSIGRELLHKEFFWDFWKNYLPIGTRIWTIDKGEKGFSRAMLNVEIETSLIFDDNHVRGLINKYNFFDILNLSRYFPSLKLIKFNNNVSLYLNNGENVDKKILKNIIINELMANIYSNNTTHDSALLFMKLSNFPIIKRDICFRRVYSLTEIELFLHDLNVNYSKEIMIDLINKGDIKSLNRFERKMISFGLK